MNATTALPSSAARAHPRLLSEELENLRRTFAERRATLREVIGALEGRAYMLLLILFALPFLPGVSVPGSSTPLGAIIAIVALQLAFGRLPWLPRRLLEWRLPAGFFAKVIPITARVVRKMERVLHPRWPAWTESRTMKALGLLAIAAAGLLLALPLFIPLTNTLPAWAILLLACGLVERDGVVVVLGYFVFFASLAFFTFLGSAATEALTHSWHWLASRGG